MHLPMTSSTLSVPKYIGNQEVVDFLELDAKIAKEDNVIRDEDN